MWLGLFFFSFLLILPRSSKFVGSRLRKFVFIYFKLSLRKKKKRPRREKKRELIFFFVGKLDLRGLNAIAIVFQKEKKKKSKKKKKKVPSGER